MLKATRWPWIGVLVLGCSTEPGVSRAPAEPDEGEVDSAAEPISEDAKPGRAASALDAAVATPASGDSGLAQGEPGALGARDADSATALDANAVTTDANSVVPGDASQHADVMQPAATPGCLVDTGDARQRGPFKLKTEAVHEPIGVDETYVRMQVWLPELPAGCKAPVVHFARGTGATCSSYVPILEHLASHGFLVTCHDAGPTGDGARCLSALELTYQKYGALADDKIASMGHAEGGAGAYACLQRAEEKWQTSKRYVGLAMFPDSGLGGDEGWMQRYAKIRSPVFQFHGTEGAIIHENTVQRAFEALDDATEAYWYEAQGASDITVATRWTQESALAFFRWQLLGDAAACQYFKALPAGADWDTHRTQAERACPVASR